MGFEFAIIDWGSFVVIMIGFIVIICIVFDDMVGYSSVLVDGRVVKQFFE